MLFEVNLIKVPLSLTDSEKEELEGNCTFVKGNVYIFEGELFALDCRHQLIDVGVVGPLGGLSQNELIDICLSAFDIEKSLFEEV